MVRLYEPDLIQNQVVPRYKKMYCVLKIYYNMFNNRLFLIKTRQVNTMQNLIKWSTKENKFITKQRRVSVVIDTRKYKGSYGSLS